MKQELGIKNYRWLRSLRWRFIPYSLFLIPYSAHAAIVPCNPLTGDQCTLLDLIELLVNIYNFLLGLSAMVAMFFIIWGGLGMFYWSFLENSSSQLEGAKLTVRRAIGGFTIVLLAYLAVNTVLVLLGVDKSSALGQLLVKYGLFGP